MSSVAYYRKYLADFRADRKIREAKTERLLAEIFELKQTILVSKLKMEARKSLNEFHERRKIREANAERRMAEIRELKQSISARSPSLGRSQPSLPNMAVASDDDDEDPFLAIAYEDNKEDPFVFIAHESVSLDSSSSLFGACRQYGSSAKAESKPLKGILKTKPNCRRGLKVRFDGI